MSNNINIELSNRVSVFKRKYFLSWFIPLIAGLIAFIALPGKTWVILIFVISILIGFFYANLKRIYFNENLVFIDKYEIQFKDIISFKAFELNLYVFLFIKISQNGKTKWYWTDPGNENILIIILKLITGRKHPFENTEKFASLVKNSKKPKNNNK